MYKKFKIYIYVICFIIAASILNGPSFYNEVNAINNESEVDLWRENNNVKSLMVKENEDTTENVKKVFLTFDDGPCINNTLKILDILQQNNVKATFFVVGKKVAQYPEIVKKLSDAGMCIASHSYSHDYRIYKSYLKYNEDLIMCNEVIRKITGKEPCRYVRLPGGSYNSIGNRMVMRNIKESIRENNFNYVDWNVCSGDAISDNVPSNKIRDEVVKQCKNKNLAVILMHDAYYKKSTVEALPYIVSYLKSEGFEFKTFNDITKEEEEKMIKDRIMNNYK